MNWKSPWVWLLLIWITGIVAYSNTFSAPFVFDDLVEIANNQILKDFDVLKLAQRYPTRIVSYVTLAMNYAASEENVLPYHAVNILIHLLVSTVVFFLARELAEQTRQRAYKTFIAGFAALLFVSHPIQTQAVTYTIQRLASLTTLFYLLGLLLYAKARSPSTSLGVKNWLHVLSWLAILLAIFSKEIAFTAPIAILMIEWFFLSRSTPEVLQGDSSGVAKRGALPANTPGESPPVTLAGESAMRPGVIPALAAKQVTSRFHLRGGIGSLLARWRFTTPYLLLLLVIPLTLWFGRPPLVGRENPLVENAVVQPGWPLTAETDSITRRDYAFTQINVVRTYLRLLVLPVNQNLDYDYPISHSLFEAETFASVLLLLAVLGLGVWLFPRNRLASFGIFFFFLALLVESSLLPIRDVIFEHRLYLPSFGFFLAAAIFAPALFRRRVGVVAVVLLIAALTTATILRNNVWQTEERLWADVVEKSPNKARGYNNLGVAYVKQGDLEKAEEYFRAAFAGDRAFAESYNNLGLLKVQEGHFAEAIDWFSLAIQVEPGYVHAFNNIGVAYLKQDKPREAADFLEKAVRADDAYLDAKINLAIAYLNNQENDKARAQVEIVLERDPNHEKARQLLQQINS